MGNVTNIRTFENSTTETIVKNEFYECPFCGHMEVYCGAFSISPDCFVQCLGCKATIEAEVPWNGMTEEEHDHACREVLLPLWNRRAE